MSWAKFKRLSSKKDLTRYRRATTFDGGGGGGGNDPDAQAYIDALDAAGYTVTGAEETAINDFVLALKADGIWAKSHAIYPFIGGTAATHKFNLKDPRDLDAAFRLTFFGGWTHSATGALGNGTNSYANTHLNPNSELTPNDNHISYYANIGYNGAATKTDIGANSGSFFGNFLDLTNTTTSVQQFRSTPENTTLGGIGDGHILGSITSNNSRVMYENGTAQGSNANAANQLMPNQEIYLGAMNYDGSPFFYSDKSFALSSIGDGLSASEVSDFYTAVQAFQTALNREV